MNTIYCDECGHKMRFSRLKNVNSVHGRAIYYCFTCEKERRVKLEDALVPPSNFS